jgi:hypothetical protein
MAALLLEGDLGVGVVDEACEPRPLARLNMSTHRAMLRTRRIDLVLRMAVPSARYRTDDGTALESRSPQRSSWMTNTGLSPGITSVPSVTVPLPISSMCQSRMT